MYQHNNFTEFNWMRMNFKYADGKTNKPTVNEYFLFM